MKHVWLTCLFSAIFLAGCKKNSDIVLATVNSESLTAKDFMRKLQSTPVQYQQLVMTSGGQRQFLDSLIKEKLLVSYARSKNAESKDGKEALKAFKEEQKYQFKNFEDRVLIQEALRRLRDNELKVTDADLKAYFDAHQSDFLDPVEVRAKHILVASEADGLQALQRLKSGESFESVARTASKDTATAVRGGELKPFQIGQGELVPEFEQAVKKLRVGETSGLVKSRFGFHIIRKQGERKLQPRTFDQVKTDLTKIVEKEKFDQWISTQEKSVKVKVDDQTLATILMPSAPNQPDKGVIP